MSSAALQAAPRQPTLSSPHIPSSTNRGYASSQVSPTQESSNALQSHQASPTSRRPPSLKANGNGGLTPSFFEPASGGPSFRTVRADSLIPTPDSCSPRFDAFSTMPPSAPPRTSSHQQSASSSRRGTYASDRTAPSPRQLPSESPRTGFYGDPNGAVDPRAKRTTAAPYASQDASPRVSSSRNGSGVDMAMPIRTHEDQHARSATGEDPSGRAARASHQVPQSPDVNAASPGQAPPEERRSSRNRNDQSRTHKGAVKFGDFFLGNTIGEGEFGKVKLGWKQDTSAQVRFCSWSNVLYSNLHLGCYQAHKKGYSWKQSLSIGQN